MPVIKINLLNTMVLSLWSGVAKEKKTINSQISIETLKEKIIVKQENEAKKKKRLEVVFWKWERHMKNMQRWKKKKKDQEENDEKKNSFQWGFFLVFVKRKTQIIYKHEILIELIFDKEIYAKIYFCSSLLLILNSFLFFFWLRVIFLKTIKI